MTYDVPTLPKTHALLSRGETRQLIATAQRGGARGQAAANRLIEHNVRLVYKYAAQCGFESGAVLKDDLVAEGLIGLWMAIERFDLRRDVEFSTYATWWVRQRIQRYVLQQGATIRIPVHLADDARHLRRLSTDFAAAHGREPDEAELRVLSGLKARRLRMALRLPQAVVSLSQPVGEFGRETGADLLTSGGAVELEDFDRRRLRETIEDLLVAQPRLARVLLMHVGLHPDCPHGLNFTEIGEKMGLSRERIRQLVEEAVRYLRHPARAGKLRGFLGGEG